MLYLFWQSEQLLAFTCLLKNISQANLGTRPVPRVYLYSSRRFQCAAYGSTIAHLGGEAFARLRIGIGAPGTSSEERKEGTVGHVLGNFHPAERPLLDEVLQEVEHGIGLIQRQGFERAGNRINSFRPDAA